MYLRYAAIKKILFELGGFFRELYHERRAINY